MTKFKVGDIIAWPTWEMYYRNVYLMKGLKEGAYRYGVYPELFKIISIEHYYGNITQYNIEQWDYVSKSWGVSTDRFFHTNSPMENGMIVINKMYLLMKYEIG